MHQRPFLIPPVLEITVLDEREDKFSELAAEAIFGDELLADVGGIEEAVLMLRGLEH